MVAKAILFEQARKHIQRWNPGAGYIANVTTYTVARLVMEINNTDALLLDIWRQQKLPTGLIDSIRRLSLQVRRILLAAPGSGNVTEWSKKEECWNRVPRPSRDPIATQVTALDQTDACGGDSADGTFW